MFFFFQAEDGIRDGRVTGVQTCALPIYENTCSARAVLRVLSEGGTVGVLSDHNTSLEEGVFVDFFGIPASTTSGLARLALRTDAAVVPGFLSWDRERRKYRLCFEPAVELSRSARSEEHTSELQS